MQKLKLAILDLYEGTPNQGMRCIREILAQYNEVIEYQVFEVRCNRELPNLDFDIYISSGGPGDPRVGDGVWENLYNEWLESVWNYNQDEENERKKFVFFICHSFQMATIHFKLATVTERKSMSFGTFPVYLNDMGEQDPIFDSLDNPFYIADFRRFQVVKPAYERLEKMGAEILALEKPRPHVPLERAIMAIRFSNEMFGTQFHPEADGDGMLIWFQQEDKKLQVIEEHGLDKYEQMIFDLSDPNKIERTQHTVIPTFLNMAIESLLSVEALV
jgi:homoserine O-succinyltransferase/O-acetyltransferase